MMIFTLFVLASFLIVLTWVSIGLYQRLDVLLIDYANLRGLEADVRAGRDHARAMCEQHTAELRVRKHSSELAAQIWAEERERIMYDRDVLRDELNGRWIA